MLIHQSENSVGENSYKVTKYKNKSWYYHYHANPELIYIHKGELIIRTPGKVENMQQGDFCLFLSGQPHSIESVGETEFHICIFADSFVKEFTKRIKGKVGEKSVFSLSKEKEEYIKNLILMYPYPDILAIKSMLYGVCSEYMASTGFIDAEDKCIQMETEILKFIDENFHRDVSLKDISESLGYEYHYLSRRFNKGFNMNFKNFLNQFRYRKAKVMLLSGNRVMADVAKKSGFQSVRNFNKVFKELSGYGPREFLKSESVFFEGSDNIRRYYD
ncbi:MAG: AraC family transcriptional regulator [Ruminococcaceae bacterium]|nr:AraC family transcriptional regulator [Oscillospiraceae bacterium]